MANILETIKKARKAGMSDDDILNKIIEANPEKAQTFKKAKERGADASAILNKVVEENKKQKVKSKKKSQEKESGDKKAKEKHKDESEEKDEEEEKPKQEDSENKEKEEKEKEQQPDKEEADKKQKEQSKSKSKKDKKKKNQEKKQKDSEKNKKKPKVKNKKSFGRRIREKVAAVRNSRFIGELLSATRYLLVGVDISDHSIEVLLLDKNGNISSYGRSILEEGLVQNGEIINQKELSEKLKETLRNTKPQPLDVPEHTREKAVKLKTKDHKAIISLPDSKTYIQVFKFKNRQNLYGQIEEEVKNTVPFDSDELYWDFMELPSNQGVRILCVAAQRDIVDMYIYFFKSTNIDPVAFEIEGASIGRALLPVKTINKEKEGKDTRKVMADSRERMIIDMGARTSILSIFNEDAKLAVSVSLPYAGHYFTKKVSEFLDISKEEAEELKQKQGFKEDGKAYSEMEKHGEKIVKEIDRASKYFEREFGGSVKEVILAGGTALLPEIDKFLNDRVNPQVKLGDPLRKIQDKEILDGKDPLLYSNVIGLGLRSLKDDPINTGINLLPEEVKSQAKKSQKSKYKSVLAVSIFITIAGILLLAASAYYLIYLPVPAPIQPLQNRILLEVEDEGQEVTETIDTAVISEDTTEAPIYAGPGEEQEVIGQATPGESYRATGQRSGWVRIEFEENEGWINSEFLSGIETVEVESEENNEEEDNEETEEEETTESRNVEFVEISQAVGTGGLNVRENPELGAPIITTATAGNIYELLNEEQGWVMIEVEGQEGWVSANFVEQYQEEVEGDETIEGTIERLME